MGLSLSAAFLAGRISSGHGAEEATVERGVFRSAVLTNPYLEPLGAENGDPSLSRARRVATEYILARQQVDPTLRVAVYVRDLDNGAWVGVNDRALFFPSSLTKVAVMIRTLLREEEEPGTLERELLFPGPESMVGEDTMREAPDSLRLHAGQRYSIAELLRRMIVYSDNYAFQLIVDDGGSEGVSKMLYDLSADQYVEDGRFYYDAHTVARLLRSLYDSSLLSRRHSEFALDLLTKARFGEGMRMTLPPDVTVASKFGFHASTVNGRRHHELHECGIVYRPRAPYVICVMTATDEGGPEELERVIGDISRNFWAQ
jgi:beta-lactamase class A